MLRPSSLRIRSAQPGRNRAESGSVEQGASCPGKNATCLTTLRRSRPCRQPGCAPLGVKRAKPGAAAFLANLETGVLRLERELQAVPYRPERYKKSRYSTRNTALSPPRRSATAWFIMLSVQCANRSLQGDDGSGAEVCHWRDKMDAQKTRDEAFAALGVADTSWFVYSPETGDTLPSHNV